jgi:17beta-estradiol 17-dehydrogenase / very-long-chain 3-oxoacyl-CoA reductase
LGNAERRDFARLGAVIHDLDIYILVNNAGMSDDITEFVNQEDEVILQVVNVNVLSVMKITKLVLPQMIQRKNGLILNIGSITGNLPICPNIQIYGPSKSFVSLWSKSLHAEYKSYGIHVENIVPGYVSTKMSRVKPSIMAPIPEVFVSSVINTVGYQSENVAYGPHNLMFAMFTLFPSWITEALVLFNMNMIKKRFNEKKNK